MMIDPGKEMKKNMDTLAPWMITVPVTNAGEPFCRLDENAPDDIKALYYKVIQDIAKPTIQTYPAEQDKLGNK